MKISAIPPADMTQLAAFWLTRAPIARPVRRRAVEAGILHPGQPPLFTHAGTQFMLEHAPRSPWPLAESNKHVSARLALATAVLIGAGPYV
jgi:hypothetical protein